MCTFDVHGEKIIWKGEITLMSKRRANPNLIRCPICGAVIAEKDKDCSGIKLFCKQCHTPYRVVVTDSHVTVTQE